LFKAFKLEKEGNYLLNIFMKGTRLPTGERKTGKT
jgi:hypothetical protein